MRVPGAGRLQVYVRSSANERRYEFAHITLVAFISRFFSSSLMLNSIEYVLTMQAHSHTHLNEVRDMRSAFSSAPHSLTW